MRKISLLIFMLISIQSFAQDSTIYNIYYNTRKAGALTIQRQKGGENKIRYWYNDRGRGPDYKFTIKTAPNGTLRYFEVNGVGYMKDSTTALVYGEGRQFKRVNGKDTSTASFKTMALFNYAYNGLYEFFYPIATDSSLVGEQAYQFQKILTKTVVVNKKQIQLELVSFGLKKDKNPVLVWMYPNHRMMAQFSEWNYLIEKGKESLATQLKKIDDSVVYANLERNSAEIMAKSINRFALFNCNYVDVENGKWIKNQTILVSNGLIEAIGDTASIKIPVDYKRINASNKTVMPGMWDMHAHQFAGEGAQNLITGITSVRDLGNSADIEVQKQKTEAGSLLGPRIAWMCGFIDFNDDMAGPCGILINNLQDGINAVKHYHDLGYKSVKLYSSMKPAYIKAIAAEAHRLGMRVHGHIPAFMTAEEAIQDGYDEINHLNMILLGYFGNAIDTRTRLRLTLMKERAFEAAPGSDYGVRLIQLMKDKKTVVDPTSLLFGPWIPKVKMNAKDSIEKASMDTIFSWLKVLYKNGIPLLPGTDAGGSMGYTNELKNYVQIGIPNAEILRMATIYPAQYCGWGNQLGTVTKGKIADLIIVGGNPLETISALDNIQIVITNGRLFYTKDLRNSLNNTNGANAASDLH